jgi:beta-glucuronidase
MLYPIQNNKRNRIDLSGIWDFKCDPDEIGEQQQYFAGFIGAQPIAVPGSWNEQYADLYNYIGLAWYQKKIFIPTGWQNERIYIRVGSANYFARVWVNGVAVGEHSGGHLPFGFEITELVRWQTENLIVIQVENHLKPTRVPAGNTGAGLGGMMSGYPNTTFDFFPYAGIHRPVVIYTQPQIYIEDVTVTTAIDQAAGIVSVRVKQSGESGTGFITLRNGDQILESKLSFKSGEAKAEITVAPARFWSPADPFLYDCSVSLTEGVNVIDRYDLEVGIRTIEVAGNQILLNGDPIFLKGFGRHEDFYASGKGLNLPLLVKDYDLLKWVGANSYRTSHYPYSEEEMCMADREGILVIDEIPAVSLQFNDSQENIHTRLEQCKQQITELVARDKNHPSIIMWSIANEPMLPRMFERLTGKDKTPLEPGSIEFFNALYDLTRSLDPTRLVTLVGMMGGPLEWQAPSDVICINRYWGWYTQPGQPEAGANLLAHELDSIYETLQKPIIISEFGADTIPGMHSQPPKMWTEEYQVDFIRGYLDVADQRDFVVGLHVWNFADFQAVQTTNRVGGMNFKGVFTRDRQPKMAAHMLRERWLKKEFPESAQAMNDQLAPEGLIGFSLEKILISVARQLDGKKPGVTSTLKFDLGKDGVYRLIITDGHTRVESGDGTADATMRVSLEDALKVFSKKLNPIIAVTTGKIKLSGDIQAFMLLQDLVEL